MPTWKKTLDAAIAANAHRPESRFVQLATTNLEARPTARTVVFRRFFEQTPSLIFCTDRRSDKVEELRGYSVAEACWYFPESRQQFRMGGNITLVEAEGENTEFADVRRLIWASLSDDSRRSFAWPEPGKPMAELAAFDVAIPSATEPLDTFMLMVLEPDQVDYLDLRPSPHRRILSVRLPERWLDMPVNP